MLQELDTVLVSLSEFRQPGNLCYFAAVSMVAEELGMMVTDDNITDWYDLCQLIPASSTFMRLFLPCSDLFWVDSGIGTERFLGLKHYQVYYVVTEVQH